MRAHTRVHKPRDDPEGGSIAGYHMLQNIKISDAAELNDGSQKKVEKDQVMCPLV